VGTPSRYWVLTLTLVVLFCGKARLAMLSVTLTSL
jgi:hypothetical protein